MNPNTVLAPVGEAAEHVAAQRSAHKKRPNRMKEEVMATNDLGR
jgi:hypothetical protein